MNVEKSPELRDSPNGDVDRSHPDSDPNISDGSKNDIEAGKKRHQTHRATRSVEIPPEMTPLNLLLRDAEEYPLLPPEEEIALAKQIEKGDLDAKEKLINSNLRFVVSVAKNYQNQGLSINDLVQEGMIGLIRTAEKFDWRKGMRFTTYADHWVRQAIQRGLAKTSRTIKIPVHLAQADRSLRNLEGKLTVSLGRPPTKDELTEAADISLDDLEDALSIRYNVVSINKPVGDDEGNEFGHFIASTEPPPESLIMADQETLEREIREPEIQREVVEAIESTLEGREKSVITRSFGLNGSVKVGAVTLSKIAREYNVSVEEIEGIRDSALAKLGRNAVLQAIAAEELNG
jgi:RNA polymerase primary sigma factor